jgi:hypothetical protein
MTRDRMESKMRHLCAQVQEIEKVKEVLVKVQEEAVIDKQQLQVEVIKAKQEVVSTCVCVFCAVSACRVCMPIYFLIVFFIILCSVLFLYVIVDFFIYTIETNDVFIIVL